MKISDMKNLSVRAKQLNTFLEKLNAKVGSFTIHYNDNNTKTGMAMAELSAEAKKCLRFKALGIFFQIILVS